MITMNIESAPKNNTVRNLGQQIYKHAGKHGYKLSAAALVAAGYTAYKFMKKSKKINEAGPLPQVIQYPMATWSTSKYLIQPKRNHNENLENRAQAISESTKKQISSKSVKTQTEKGPYYFTTQADLNESKSSSIKQRVLSATSSFLIGIFGKKCKKTLGSVLKYTSKRSQKLFLRYFIKSNLYRYH